MQNINLNTAQLTCHSNNSVSSISSDGSFVTVPSTPGVSAQPLDVPVLSPSTKMQGGTNLDICPSQSVSEPNHFDTAWLEYLKDDSMILPTLPPYMHWDANADTEDSSFDQDPRELPRPAQPSSIDVNTDQSGLIESLSGKSSFPSSPWPRSNAEPHFATRQSPSVEPSHPGTETATGTAIHRRAAIDLDRERPCPGFFPSHAHWWLAAENRSCDACGKTLEDHLPAQEGRNKNGE